MNWSFDTLKEKAKSICVGMVDEAERIVDSVCAHVNTSASSVCFPAVSQTPMALSPTLRRQIAEVPLSSPSWAGVLEQLRQAVDFLSRESPREGNRLRQQLTVGETRLPAGCEDPLTIAVAGKFSCGKSCFINSLIGYDIASCKIEPTTRCATVFRGDGSKKTVEIRDGAGHVVSLAEYKQKVMEKSCRSRRFEVIVPDARWEPFELIDTPGYDSVDGGAEGDTDSSISRSAVECADVVFFLVDVNDGTLTQNSVEYLKGSVSSGCKRLYVVVNKMDKKPPLRRRPVLAAVERSLQENEVRYESVLPYSSKMEIDGMGTATFTLPDLREKLFQEIERLSGYREEVARRRVAVEERHIRETVLAVAVDSVREVQNVLTRKERMKGNGIDRHALTEALRDALIHQAGTFMQDNLGSYRKMECIYRDWPHLNDWQVSVDVKNVFSSEDAHTADFDGGLQLAVGQLAAAYGVPLQYFKMASLCTAARRGVRETMEQIGVKYSLSHRIDCYVWTNEDTEADECFSRFETIVSEHFVPMYKEGVADPLAEQTVSAIIDARAQTRAKELAEVRTLLTMLTK